MVTSNVTAFHQLLRTDFIRVNLPVHSKVEALHGIIDLLRKHPNVNDFDRMQQAVLKREKMMSTGVGNGLALPHAKTSAVDSMTIAFVTTAEPIEFNSVDNLPVRLLLLMVSTEREKTQHIKLLSRISRFMNEERFRGELLQARTPEEVISIFKMEEPYE